MTRSYQPTLRDRLVAKHNPSPPAEDPLEIPADGQIPAATVATIGMLAIHAQAGDIRARDRLYTALHPRLYRKGFILRPWPNTPRQTGIWDRDDVDQESWIIFAELLSAWDGELPFVPYLFARFAWRLRDRILRGIGRPLPPIGGVRVPEELLAEVLSGHDSDQPESVLLANNLLAHILESMMRGEIETLEPRELMTVLKSPLFGPNLQITTLPDDGHPFSQIEAA